MNHPSPFKNRTSLLEDTIWLILDCKKTAKICTLRPDASLALRRRFRPQNNEFTALPEGLTHYPDRIQWQMVSGHWPSVNE
jgi:hypothetical protein